MAAILVIFIHHNLHRGTVEVRFNRDSPVNTEMPQSKIHPDLCPNADVWRAISRFFDRMKHDHLINIILIYVKGHMYNSNKF